MDKIIPHRIRIDKIDEKLMKLLEERFEIANEIGLAKSKENAAVYDQKREDFILDKTSNHRHSQSIKEVYNVILKESKNIQRK